MPCRNNWTLVHIISVILVVTLENHGTTGDASMVKANRKFAANLYKVLKYTPQDNIVFSPAILSASFEMLRQGANGSTELELQKLLGMEKINSGNIHDMYTDFVQGLPENEEVNFETTRRLYMPYTHRVWSSYKDRVQDEFPDLTDPVKTINFGDNAEAARKINTWVKKTMNGKIEKIVRPEHFTSTTSLVLVSAAYFNGEWEYSFRARQNKNELFYVNETHYTDVILMQRTGRMKYIDLPEIGATAVSVPYAGDKLSLVIILPKERFGLAEVEFRQEYLKNAKNFSFNAIPSRMKKANVDLFLPKFKIESSLELNSRGSHLQKMGLQNSVSQRILPDFSRISPQPGLFLDQVIHRAVLDVNENGVQPSPSLVKLKSGEKYITFRADHPFLAYVYDKEAKAVLLMAKKIV